MTLYQPGGTPFLSSVDNPTCSSDSILASMSRMNTAGTFSQRWNVCFENKQYL